MIMHNTQYHNQYHLIGIIDMLGLTDLTEVLIFGIQIGTMVTAMHLGIEIECGMTGYGVFHMEVV
jgi:hypothetical protein